jgi:hypothetical protein
MKYTLVGVCGWRNLLIKEDKMFTDTEGIDEGF